MNGNDCRLAGQLRNVFRILADPEHRLRGEAIELRTRISAAWRLRAEQEDWFAWPTTAAAPGRRRLNGLACNEQGMLGFLGYHVGETQPTAPDIRRCILDFVFDSHLPPLNGRAYHAQWGKPSTAQRLHKLANALAAFARNARRQDRAEMACAIRDWEEDLSFLHRRYYVNVFHFEWPDTAALLEYT